jgi:hypothetical protein
VIERRARTVPTDVVLGRFCVAAATAAVIDSIASGWLADAASDARSDERFQAARPTARARTIVTSRADPTQPREFMTALPLMSGDLEGALPSKTDTGT